MSVEMAAIVGEEDGKWMHLLVSNGSKEVHKKVKLFLTNDWMTALKLIRQAERDFACLEYGDKWKEHVGPYFSVHVTPEEQVLVDRALGLIDKTFEEADEDRRGSRDEYGVGG
jgi:hypothetical protein